MAALVASLGFEKVSLAVSLRSAVGQLLLRIASLLAPCPHCRCAPANVKLLVKRYTRVPFKRRSPLISRSGVFPSADRFERESGTMHWRCSGGGACDWK